MGFVHHQVPAVSVAIIESCSELSFPTLLLP